MSKHLQASHKTEGGSLRPVSLLLLGGLFCHGILLTNDGVTWDGWYVRAWLIEKYWREMYDFFASTGLPAYAWLNHLFAYAGDITGAFMVVTVACLIIQPPCIYALARRMAGMSSGESFCLALLSAAMPLFTAAQELVMLYFVITQAFFMVACVAAARGSDETSWLRWPLHVFAIVAFMVSFMNAALLVFYGGFFVLLFLQWRRSRASVLWRDVLRFIPRHTVYLLLPPLAWILRQKLAPQHGWYENYNHPLENLPMILPSLESFFDNVIPYHFKSVWRWIFKHLAFVIPLVLLVRWVALRGPASWQVACSRVKTLPLLLFGTVLLFLAIFPFAAAGKTFSSRPVGDPSRYAILTGLPLAILLFGLLRAALFHRSERCVRWMGPICVALSIILGIQISRIYIEERAVWVMNRSILHNALHNDEVKNSSIIVLPDSPLAGQIVYGTYAFGTTFGSRDRLVTPGMPANQKEFTPSEIALTIQRTTLMPNSFNKINPAGQQIYLKVIANREGANDWELSMKYLWRRMFGSTQDMNAFLAGLTRLEIRVMRPPTSPKTAPVALKESASLPPITAGNAFTNSVGMRMMPLPSLGWAARTETTQDEFQQVMGTNPSFFTGPSFPVERVSWDDAMEFCRRLTETESKAGRIPEGMRYRLPSLEEHEVMAKPTDVTQAVLGGQTVFWQPEPAGSRPPNALGLCDVLGNVWEWTNDWGDKRKFLKVAAGGGFENQPTELQPPANPPAEHYARMYAMRLQGPIRMDYPDQAFWNRGFRCVLAKTR